MNRQQVAMVAGLLLGWIGYHATRYLVKRLDVQAWKQAWNAVPLPSRDAFRDALMTEEGISSDG